MILTMMTMIMNRNMMTLKAVITIVTNDNNNDNDK